MENSPARPTLPLDKGRGWSSSTSQAEGNEPFPSIIIPQIPAHSVFGTLISACWDLGKQIKINKLKELGSGVKWGGWS